MFDLIFLDDYFISTLNSLQKNSETFSNTRESRTLYQLISQLFISSSDEYFIEARRCGHYFNGNTIEINTQVITKPCMMY